ncbi:MAG: DJ-1/PfpI family protein [Clostridiaceae bacterium]|nr:DJ-1/PfpI family protein [Clostridiaceae bacterium]
MSKKKIAVLFADGFEEIEALSVVDYLRRANIEITMVSIKNSVDVIGAHEIELKCNGLLSELKAEIAKDYDGIVLPGGLPGAEYLRDSDAVIELTKQMSENDKIVAAICAAPIVLERAGLTKGNKGTSYPGFDIQLSFREYKEDIVVQDGNLITARGPATAIYFALKIIEVLCGKDTSDQIAEDLLVPLVESQICN